MRYGRVVSSAVVAWLAYMVVSPLANNLILSELYGQHLHVFRPADTVNPVPGFAASAFGFLVFAYMFAKGYEGGPAYLEGLRFGVLVGLLISTFGLVWNYVMLPLSAKLVAAWILDTIGEMGLYGAIVGAVYRPPVKPRG